MSSEVSCFFPCLPRVDTQADRQDAECKACSCTNLTPFPNFLLPLSWLHSQAPFTQAGSSAGATYLLQHTLLLALCLYNHHHRAFISETLYSFQRFCSSQSFSHLVFSLLGNRLEPTPQYPTNHCFIICIAR